MPLKRGQGVPLWCQIQEILLRRITDGDFIPGQRLPTEQELAGHFSVNRHTVRRALATLEECGLVRIEQGRGAFVKEKVIRYPVSRRTRYTQNLAGQYKKPGHTILESDILVGEAQVIQALELPAGSKIVYIKSKAEADGRAIILSYQYFPHYRFEGLISAYHETGSTTAALAKLGVDDYFRKITHITAQPATAEETRLFGLPKGRPVLVTESINVDMDGRPIEYGISHMAGDLVQLVVES